MVEAVRDHWVIALAMLVLVVTGFMWWRRR